MLLLIVDFVNLFLSALLVGGACGTVRRPLNGATSGMLTRRSSMPPTTSSFNSRVFARSIPSCRY